LKKLVIIQNPVIVNRNADFFYKTNRFESIRNSNPESECSRTYRAKSGRAETKGTSVRQI